MRVNPKSSIKSLLTTGKGMSLIQNYTLQNSLNGDETGLFSNLLSDKSYIVKKKSCNVNISKCQRNVQFFFNTLNADCSLLRLIDRVKNHVVLKILKVFPEVTKQIKNSGSRD